MDSHDKAIMWALAGSVVLIIGIWLVESKANDALRRISAIEQRLEKTK